MTTTATPPPKPTRRPRRAPSGTAAVLQQDERVMSTAIISAGIYWKTICVLGLAVLLFILMILHPSIKGLVILGFLVTLVTFISAWLTKHYLLLMLTDRRVIFRYGVMNLETVQLHYDKIESVELAWTPMGRLLGYATVLITGVGNRITGVPFVGNAVALRAAFDDRLTAREDKVVKVEVENPRSV